MSRVISQFASTMSKYKRRNKIKFRELSEVTGLSCSYLCEISKGKKAINLTSALKIAKKLNFSIDDMKDLV